VLPGGRQIAEMFILHEGASWRDAQRRAIEVLARVRVPAPERRARDYPHQLSGGMRQRVMIAIALACSPDLLIADEPTTALDVTVQSEIVDLMRDLCAANGTAILMISHDLGLVASICRRVGVMYAGRLVEMRASADVFKSPAHPLHAGSGCFAPAAGLARRGRAPPVAGNLRCGALDRGLSAGLPLPSALRALDRHLQDRRAGGDAARRGRTRPLSSSWVTRCSRSRSGGPVPHRWPAVSADRACCTR
jgi:hypothetical protein